MCHEPLYANRAMFPDLRYSPALNSAEAFNAIVIDGALQSAGMASFKGTMTTEEVQSVRAYTIERANQAKNAPPAAGALSRRIRRPLGRPGGAGEAGMRHVEPVACQHAHGPKAKCARRNNEPPRWVA